MFCPASKPVAPSSNCLLFNFQPYSYVILEPAVPPGNFSEMQVFRPHSRVLNQKLWRGLPSNLSFQGFRHMLKFKFENLCSRECALSSNSQSSSWYFSSILCVCSVIRVNSLYNFQNYYTFLKDLIWLLQLIITPTAVMTALPHGHWLAHAWATFGIPCNTRSCQWPGLPNNNTTTTKQRLILLSWEDGRR